ncbi:MAG: adenylate/guanylate cyclase domain-containing protein [Candidatus Dormibacteraeota bacterium]|nr:adenylate/guanylate cyclase domain-containing protein [Candidatus Dormibacteraeota bacterium]
MAPLDAKTRSQLPDSAFAYIDPRGRRSLPINDEAHVRNALARFNQMRFEDDDARDRARMRLLKAARKYGIVPVGFITAQLRAQGSNRKLPAGPVTFLLSDIEGSTRILQLLGDRWPAVLADARKLLRAAVREAGGSEVDTRADEFFAVFAEAPAALAAALAIQRGSAARSWPDGHQVRFRIGLHHGSPTLTDTGYVGLDVHTAVRICSAGHGGQIVLSGALREVFLASPPDGVNFGELGSHQLPGLPSPIALFQIEVEDLPFSFPPLRVTG